MSNDPYAILGVSRYATDEEIKKAYRELAKKYHPDNFSDENMKKLANEKMQEINEAYNILTKNSQENTNNSQYYGTYTSSYAAHEFMEIRQLIQMNNFSDAEIKLEAISLNDRNAEWNFLKGCVMSQRGWYMDASRFFETACNMEPNNAEYRQAYETMQKTANNYSRGYRQGNTNQSTGNFCGDFCSSLCMYQSCFCCTDCCCDSCLNGCN